MSGTRTMFSKLAGLVVLWMSFLPHRCMAQDAPFLGSVEEHFIGGRSGYIKAFSNKIHVPDSLKKKEHVGTVFFTLEIDTLGSVSGFECLRFPIQAFCEEVGRKILLTNGMWKPMVINGRKHSYRVTAYQHFAVACR